MEITGKLHTIGEVKTFDGGFMVQEFYLDTTRYDSMTGQKYENYVKLQNLHEKLNLSKFDIGDIVKVTFFINGRTYEKDGKKFFAQNLNAHKIELVRKLKPQSHPQGGTADEYSEDDLPF